VTPPALDCSRPPLDLEPFARREITVTHLYVTLQILAATMLSVAGEHLSPTSRRRPRDDAGLSTLEIVVISLGLFLLAGALVAAITVAVNSRMNQIQ
jgi:hypothetical protein